MAPVLTWKYHCPSQNYKQYISKQLWSTELSLTTVNFVQQKTLSIMDTYSLPCYSYSVSLTLFTEGTPSAGCRKSSLIYYEKYSVIFCHTKLLPTEGAGYQRQWNTVILCKVDPKLSTQESISPKPFSQEIHISCKMSISADTSVLNRQL